MSWECAITGINNSTVDNKHPKRFIASPGKIVGPMLLAPSAIVHEACRRSPICQHLWVVLRHQKHNLIIRKAISVLAGFLALLSAATFAFNNASLRRESD